MTTDFIQNRYTVPKKWLGFWRMKKPHANNDRQGHDGIELTRNESFVEGHHDIFDVLASQHNLKKEDLELSINATTALLKKAQTIIEKAEEKIHEQDLRIQTLENLSTVDELTGMVNLQGFTKAFVREIARSHRGHSKGGLLVMIDIENLNSIREKHGPDASDTCARLVSRFLSQETRKMDLAARLQDDEFVLLFTNAGTQEAIERAQHLSARLNKLSLIWHGHEIEINASISLKSYGPEDCAKTLVKDVKQ